MYSENSTDKEMAVAKNSTKEAYMDTAFLSGLKRDIYGVMLNELHNAFQMRQKKYSKTLTAAYYFAINWKGYMKGAKVTPKEGVAFSTEYEEADVNTTNGMKLTRSVKPLICHICGNNHNSNKFRDREESAPD